MLSKALLALVLLSGSMFAHADAELQIFLDQTLTAARDKGHLPAVGTVIQINGKIAAEAVLGVRALGHPQMVTLDDRWHIGSDTKAFTATMIARLVEQRLMSFDDTLGTSFPALTKSMNPAYRSVTIAQLLSHTAGLPPLTDDQDLPAFMAVVNSAKGVIAQRTAIARHYLTMPPASKVGEFEYSNVGYIIAGAIAEAHTGKTWEILIREQIFTPLGIKSAGFGSPGTSGKFDQPSGHEEAAGQLVPRDPAKTEGANPPALGPAGTINIALKDWMRFAQDHLDGTHGRGKLLKPETYRRLHTPVAENYAFGWGVRLDPSGEPLLITHSGSDGYWLADIRIMPKHDIIFVIAMNTGNEAANASIRDIVKPLQDRLKPFE